MVGEEVTSSEKLGDKVDEFAILHEPVVLTDEGMFNFLKYHFFIFNVSEGDTALDHCHIIQPFFSVSYFTSFTKTKTLASI